MDEARGIQTGDIVEVDCKGRRFYALVTGPASGGLALAPTDRRVSHYSCRSHEVVGHWVKRGRPRTTAALVFAAFYLMFLKRT